MNGAVLLLAGCGFFTLAYRLHGRFLERVLGVDPQRPTPAHTMRDNVDYLPTRPAILFGHHFASIAGAGPIVGPVLAAQYGWLAVALWVVLGCVFIGCMHDMISMHLSIRHQGRSIGTIIESLMGYGGRMLFLSFCWCTLILVVAEFTRLVAQTFVELPAVATVSLLFVALAVAFGVMVYRAGMNIILGSLIFVPLTFACILVGIKLPLDLTLLLGLSKEGANTCWIIVLLAYCFAASVLPVWLLLQPRDYLNSFLLYAMMIMGILGILAVAPGIKLEMFTGWRTLNPGSGAMEPLFPLLFVTVACGACSGFHALVASGTTAKQVESESHVRPIAYGAMLVEGVLALIALIAVGTMTQVEYGDALKAHGPVALFAGGIASFTEKLGLSHQHGSVFISLALAAFLMTTLDTATRLARFTWQEFFMVRRSIDSGQPTTTGITRMRKIGTDRISATLVAVVATGWLLLGGGTKSLWPIFATSNQLLAALTLFGCLLWLIRHKRPVALALIPMLFMATTSGAAVVTIFKRSLALWREKGFATGGVMTFASGTLLCLALSLIILGAITLIRAIKSDRKTI